MFNVSISKLLLDRNNKMALGTIFCDVVNTNFNESLWKEIESVSNNIRDKYILETIKDNIQIDATRKMYLACGKKPGRYRPSAEALMRRIVKGDKLYQINTLVDLINLLSIKTGYSIGGFDADNIIGSNIIAGIGEENEHYEGIGRGEINIYKMPVIRDEKGAIGTPTSDEVRTALSLKTKKIFININGYTGKDDLVPAIDIAVELLNKYANANNIKTNIVLT